MYQSNSNIKSETDWPVTCPFNVKANYSWSGEEKSDLGFLEGDIIEVMKVKGMWFWGKLIRNKKCGSFPSTYVNLVTMPNNQAIENKHKLRIKTSLSGKSNISNTGERSQDSRHRTKSLKDQCKRDGNQRNATSVPTSPTKQHIGERIVHSKSSNNISLQKQLQNLSMSNGNSPSSPVYADKSLNLGYKHSYSNHTSPSRTNTYNIDSPSRQQVNSITTNDSFSTSYSEASSSNKKLSESYFKNTTYFNNTTSSSNASSFLLLSNFSATSAGSFARHKFARSFTESKMKQDCPNTAFALDINNSSSNNRNSRNGKNNGLFTPELPSLSMIMKNNNNSFVNNDGNSSFNGLDDEGLQKWAFVNKFLNRGNSITSRERYDRRMKFLESGLDTDLILEPHTQMDESILENEGFKNSRKSSPIDIWLQETDLENFDRKVLKKISKDGVLSLESFSMQNFGHKYMNSLERLRAIFVFCTETYQLIDDNGATDFRKPASNLEKVLHVNHCTPYELTWLFKKLCNYVGVKCDIVIGFLKTPDSNNLDFQLNHCWLSCMINNEHRFVDAVLGNISNPIHEYINDKVATKCEDFYFLTEPKQLIYSHIPYKIKDQHLSPEIDNLVPMSLPVVFPSFFNNRIKFQKFDNSLSYMTSNDCYEVSFAIDKGVEIFATVVSDDSESENGIEASQFDDSYKAALDLSLVQIKWVKSRRIAVIKAILPKDSESGNLHIHTGTKGLQNSLVNVHPLSVVIPLRQQVKPISNILADDIQYEFTRIIPSITASNLDIYIKKPQNKILSLKHEYNIQIILQPSNGMMQLNNSDNNNYKKIILQSPSGKVYKLSKMDNNVICFGTWDIKVKVNELGSWNALITNDSGAGWTSFCEWVCI
ncbi:hypothetical protein QEN19_000688 [Hanseniaspora menglaensis]